MANKGYGDHLILTFLLGTFFQAAVSANDENQTQSHPTDRLIKHVLDSMSIDSPSHMPQERDLGPVLVTLDLTLIQILEFDQKKQKLITQMWQSMTWRDERVSWNPEDFGSLTALRVDQSLMWKPDIVLYNTQQKMESITPESKIVVYSDGSMKFIPLSIYESTCKVELTNFPFDIQVCELDFASWHYETTELDIISENNFTAIDLSHYVENVEWKLARVSFEKNFVKYRCCPGFYAVVTLKLHLQRNSSYYTRVLLLPVILLSVISVFVFCVPTHRPDRTGIALGMFTSFMLFLLLVVNISPPTAESKLGMYLFFCVGIVTSIIITSMLLIQVSSWKSKVPAWLRKIVLCYMFRCLFPWTKRDSVHTPGPSKVSTSGGGGHEWTLVVSVLDRLLFFVYGIILVIGATLFFPTRKQ